jgi:hypothetical protein
VASSATTQVKKHIRDAAGRLENGSKGAARARCAQARADVKIQRQSSPFKNGTASEQCETVVDV